MQKNSRKFTGTFHFLKLHLPSEQVSRASKVRNNPFTNVYSHTLNPCINSISVVSSDHLREEAKTKKTRFKGDHLEIETPVDVLT